MVTTSIDPHWCSCSWPKINTLKNTKVRDLSGREVNSSGSNMQTTSGTPISTNWSSKEMSHPKLSANSQWMGMGQMTQDNRTAFEDESIRVKNESVQQELNTFFNKERPNVTYEDNEDFQTQDVQIRFGHCHEEMLKDYGRNCSQIFSEIMSELGEENWCNREMVIRYYSSLTMCMEVISHMSGCFYPNRVVEQLFVRIHQQYFSLCSNEEDLLDAPAGVVLVATLLPILLIPFIVYTVVWKSSLRD
ncbi:uncharacterized protein [Sinocyclocheilus grahami]|uniref:uncharacterized protein isoform X1 n=1 Tax=Sinocyclocheilus grahami TaxID=75366 RepID=UPI0007AD61E8|nr:PREDICTED: uncharacterized protein LOC107599701 isoform X1 [Sinocyclocheilus grahami]